MNQGQNIINQTASENSQMQASNGNNNQQTMNSETSPTKNYIFNEKTNIGTWVDTNNGEVKSIQNNSQLEQKSLPEAAAEIKKLLDELSKSYPSCIDDYTDDQKNTLAKEVIESIEKNPNLMKKILSALGAGSTAALEQVLSHPAASFVIAALEDWQQNRQSTKKP